MESPRMRDLRLENQRTQDLLSIAAQNEEEREARKAARQAEKAAAQKTKSPQKSREDLEDMTPEQIIAAYESGDFNASIGWAPTDVEVVDRARAGENLTRQDIEVLHRLEQHPLIIQAHDQGRITENTKENN